MCEHDNMYYEDSLRDKVELWLCECGYEEVRLFHTPHPDDYIVA